MSGNKLESARECLRAQDVEGAKRYYEFLLRSPEHKYEAEVALRLASLYFASEADDVKKMDSLADDLKECFASYEPFETEFLRALAPWVSKCFIPPSNEKIFSRKYTTGVRQELAKSFLENMDALLFSDYISSLSADEQRAIREGAVALDKFSGKFFPTDVGYTKVGPGKFTETELKMKEVYKALDLEDPRPVFKSDKDEKREKVLVWIFCILLAIAAMIAGIYNKN
ncbi:MAG: hypothetical protein K6G50_04380 [bacterium]|nr:hypothetical protein [bacterium]